MCVQASEYISMSIITQISVSVISLNPIRIPVFLSARS